MTNRMMATTASISWASQSNCKFEEYITYCLVFFLSYLNWYLFYSRSERSKLASQFRSAFVYLNDLAATRVNAQNVVNYWPNVFEMAVPLLRLWEPFVGGATEEFDKVRFIVLKSVVSYS